MIKKSTLLFSFAALFFISSCKTTVEEEKPLSFDEGVNAEIILPNGERKIRTPDGANALDLETPLRCNVNWKDQQIVLTLPFSNSAFRIERLEKNDKLPGFEVTGFTFETMSAEKALYKLTKEAGIKLVAKDAPYTSLSGENLKGEFSDIIDMITQAAEIFYSYDADNKVMTLSRKTEISLYVPQSRPIILSMLDVLRGSGITDMTTNWADYSITFNADMELQNKIVSLMEHFENNPNLIAYDVNIFKIYPNNNCDIEWKKLLDDFEFGTITTAQTGVIGRVLTTTNEISLEKLQQFIGKYAKMESVSEGKFIVPDQWLSRFDVGKCGKMETDESELSILAKASLIDNNRIASEITLETTKGQITNFKVRNKLGENFVIIGIPNEVFIADEPHSETVIFIVPRLIRTLKTTETIKNKI